VKPINLEPRYSTMEIPGKCIKCLAEKQLDSCLRLLLMGKTGNKELEERYASLLSFLKSPESKKLRNESEKYLSEGKEVEVKIYYSKVGKAKYEVKLSELNPEESK